MDDIDSRRLDPPRDVKILRDNHSEEEEEEEAGGHVREGDKRGEEMEGHM